MRKTAVLFLLLALLACDQDEKPIPKPVEAPEPHIVRPAALAGRGWYPGNAEKLGELVDGLMAKAPKWEGEAPTALVVPHAGYSYAGPMTANIQLGNLCARAGKKLELNKAGKITNDRAINELAWREPRTGWGPLEMNI
jgi:hypothetical protein